MASLLVVGTGVLRSLTHVPETGAINLDFIHRCSDFSHVLHSVSRRTLLAPKTNMTESNIDNEY